MPTDQTVEIVARAIEQRFPTFGGSKPASSYNPISIALEGQPATLAGGVSVADVATAALAALEKAGMVVVPAMPTEAMWGGLARDFIMWRDFQRPTGVALYEHLKAKGTIIPGWLREEIPETDHVPPKGTAAACIYRAMLEASTPAGREALEAGE